MSPVRLKRTCIVLSLGIVLCKRQVRLVPVTQNRADFPLTCGHLLGEGCWALAGSCLPGLGWSPLHWTLESRLLHVSGAPFLSSPLLFLLGPEDSCQLLSDTEVCPSNSENWTWLCWVFPSVCFGRETLKTVNWGNCRAQLLGFPSLRGLYVLLSDVCCLENCCFFYFVWCFPSFCFVE